MCDGIILACLLSLVVLGGVSFFADPRYEKGVWIVLAAVSHLLSAAAGAKFGLAVPRIGVEIRGADETQPTGSPANPDPGDGFSDRVGFAPGKHGESQKRD